MKNHIAFLLLTLSCVASFATAQDRDSSGIKMIASSEIDEPKSQAASSTATLLKGRLPRYFAAFVNLKQRQTIYRLQGEYKSRIDELQKKLAELKAEEQAAYDAVLTDAQLKEVETLRVQATARLATRKSTSNIRTKHPKAGADR